MSNYERYKVNTATKLHEEACKRYKGGHIDKGIWRGTNKTYSHILPLGKGVKNSRNSREKAIEEYLGVTIDENFLPKKKAEKGETLHPYTHHLNSSQLLCYMTFRPLLRDDHKPKPELIHLLHSLGIDISPDAICDFEYSDGWRWEQGNEPEGTSFDFHISESNGSEYFFEIKFTEAGFGKAKDDDRHNKKINDIYLDRIKQALQKGPTPEECRKYYQLFRNIIRGNADSKTVIFITDSNNELTERDIAAFKKKFLVSSRVKPLFISWQEVCENWPTDISKPFQFICF